MGSRAGHEGYWAGAGMKTLSPLVKYTAEDENEIDWLEQHVNYAGEDLTFQDLMFLRMERGIQRLARERGMNEKGQNHEL